MKKHWKSDFVSLPTGQKLHVKQTGGDLPSLFLIHGVTDSGQYWSRLAEDLEDAFNVFMPDMIGHGQSDRLDGVISVEDMAQHVLALMDHYAIERCQICGHSMGAGITMLAATAQPERFTAVLFEDPSLSNNPPPTPPLFLNMLEMTSAWRDEHIILRQLSIDEALTQLTTERADWHPEDIKNNLEDRLAYDLTVFDRIDFSSSRRWQEELPKINAPILLVIGEAELGSLIEEEVAKTAVSLMNDGQYVVVKGTGHGIHRENYPAFRDVVLPFFTKHKVSTA
ncbi:MAG: alpha/beta hydrolase [Chloroflexota bacterium]